MNNRIDYILIWGHGLISSKLIVEELRSNPNFEIKKIIYHKPKSIKKIIDVIYSYDYAPLEHLKSKTKYLESTPNEVIFVFVKNVAPDVDYLGEGDFRHEESLTLKEVKESIRNKYNPRLGGERTENHVIHASDNELQTDYILKYLGFNDGVNIFSDKNRFMSCPYYIKEVKNIHIKKVPTDILMCNVVTGKSRYEYTVKTVNLFQSPQYRGLTENILVYKNYIDKYLGGPLTDDYYADRLIKLSEELNYLQGNQSSNYILVKKEGEKLIIVDGLHRASILAFRGEDEIVVAEVVFNA